MIRVNRRDVEPEPQPLRRHPVATWKRREGATIPQHPLPVNLPNFGRHTDMRQHQSDQHRGHIVFGANQPSCCHDVG